MSRGSFPFGGPRPEGWEPGNKGETYTPTLLEPDDVAALLPEFGGGPKGARNRALVGLLYRTGMSVGEALALKRSDVGLRPGEETVLVRTGRRAQRTLALDDFAIGLMSPWLDERAQLPKKGGYLLCTTEGSTKGGQWNARGVKHALDNAAERAGLAKKRVHAGAFRFSLAAELIIEQWPIPYIMAQLGMRNYGSFASILEHLAIALPDEREVAEIIRGRGRP